MHATSVHALCTELDPSFEAEPPKDFTQNMQKKETTGLESYVPALSLKGETATEFSSRCIVVA